MRKQSNEKERKCPRCGATEKQHLQGQNRSGTRRCICRICEKTYTLNPKSSAYSEEVRQQAIKMYYGGVSGRGVGKILGMGKENVVRWIKKNEQS